ncbi:unnamed protein product [Pleuronectes platessa]|uniref:Uncharacterized protein n=1 Tax=Pleuronectes platessa TaxID=8262 RepID=A0A9N7V6M3_PLEPL|nr:unnamed protein product [Pleuronectes platessa]
MYDNAFINAQQFLADASRAVSEVIHHSVGAGAGGTRGNLRPNGNFKRQVSGTAPETTLCFHNNGGAITAEPVISRGQPGTVPASFGFTGILEVGRSSPGSGVALLLVPSDLPTDDNLLVPRRTLERLGTALGPRPQCEPTPGNSGRDCDQTSTPGQMCPRGRMCVLKTNKHSHL